MSAPAPTAGNIRADTQVRPYRWRDQYPKVNSFPRPFKEAMRTKWKL